MTDRELLELAAKAAGIEYTLKDNEYFKTHKFFGLWLVKHNEPSEYERRYWNPLADDGDALRMAIDLGIDVLITNTGIESGITVTFPALDNSSRIEEEHKQHPYAATRRAIVRAAAEIGKEMK